MKINPLNCGVEIVDVDIRSLTESDYQEIKHLYNEHLIIVFRNQPLLNVPFAKLVQKCGTGIVNWPGCVWNSKGQLQKNANYDVGIQFDVLPDPFTYTGPDEEFYVQRVTGMKIKGENSGIFPHAELDWHNNINKVGSTGRGVALQGVSGLDGTATAFMDTTKAYAALSDELKERCQNVVGRFRYNIAVWGEGMPSWQEKNVVAYTSDQEYYEMPLVNVNSYNGKPGLYFHFLNDCSFPTDPELLEILKEHCLKPEFIYTHWWNAGDIVISEQLLTLHKRILRNPDSINERVLHRYTFSM